MPPRRGRRRPWGWVALVALALGIGFWAGRGRTPESPPLLARPTPAPTAPPGAEAVVRLEAELGALDTQGVRMAVGDAAAAEALLGRVQRIEGVGLGAVHREPGLLRTTLTVDGRSVSLAVAWPETRPPGVRLAVVIDDLGRDLAVAEAFLDLPIPVTLAVLPHLAHSRAVAALAQSRGVEFLLHLPMEPQGYPGRDPGEGALLAAMTEAEVHRALDAALASTPGAAGVNNHMGSRLTELPAPMSWVMGALAPRELYFLDSATTAASVAAATAREEGLRWARRDVFLDNVQTTEAVAGQLEKAVEAARRQGQAVAIGHPHPETLAALRAWAPRLGGLGVEVVPLGRLVRRGGGA